MMPNRRGGRMGGYALGPGGYCVCPQCGHKEWHAAGCPCPAYRCPRCGTPLVRETR